MDDEDAKKYVEIIPEKLMIRLSNKCPEGVTINTKKLYMYIMDLFDTDDSYCMYEVPFFIEAVPNKILTQGGWKVDRALLDSLDNIFGEYVVEMENRDE